MKIERNWKTVKFEELGANVGTADFEGLIGFEECHDYDTLSSRKVVILQNCPLSNFLIAWIFIRF